jgi:hypothetical protein
MRCFPRLPRIATALFLLSLFTALNTAPALAGLAPSRVSGATEITSTRDADLLVAQRMLEHKVVAQKLRDYGVTPEEARARLAGMSDDELHQLATASAGLPSGSDGLGLIVTLLVIALLVILIMKLMNKEIVVK